MKALKSVTLAISLFAPFLLISQQSESHLDIDDAFYTDFSDGIPQNSFLNFSGFNADRNISEQIKGLTPQVYLVSETANANIDIELNNIGRIVLHARLALKNDSVISIPDGFHNGIVTVTPYRNGQPLDEYKKKVFFDEDFFHQVHFNTHLANINRVKVEFSHNNPEEVIFLLSKLKVYRLSAEGELAFITREEKEVEILNGIVKRPEFARSIKNQHSENLDRIEEYYRNLESIITSGSFQEMAELRVNSLNPFSSAAFKRHYHDLLSKASTAEKVRIENMLSELENENYTDLAKTLDNLFTGGKFGSLISLMDGLFKNTLNLNSSLQVVLYNE
ncbi:MAG: hypothetical protein WBG42_13460, partial [Cryomorphaceae bacterium]